MAHQLVETICIDKGLNQTLGLGDLLGGAFDLLVRFRVQFAEILWMNHYLLYYLG
jgi:hypothetical protein